MSKLQQAKQSLNEVLFLVLLCGIVFGIQDKTGFMKNFPLVGSYITEFMAGLAGVTIGFLINSISQLKNENVLSQRVRKGLIKELETNKKILEDLKRNLLSERFVQFQTTIWDMFKEKLTFDDVDLYFRLGNLYHGFIEFNNNISLYGIVAEAKSRMRRDSSKLFNDMIKEIDDILPLLKRD